MEYSFEDMKRIEAAMKEKARLELEMERDLEDVKQTAISSMQAEVEAEQPQTVNDVLRSQLISPAKRGGQLLDQMINVHSKSLEKQRQK